MAGSIDVVRTPQQKTDDFIQRVENILNTMVISKNSKKVVLELLKMQIKYPPNDEKEAIDRYIGIIENET